MPLIRHHTPEPLTLSPEAIDSLRQGRGTPPESPTLLAKTRHATAAGVRILRAAITGDPIRVSRRERNRRLAICRQCPYWDETGNIGLGECKNPACGCTRIKQGLATESCPLAKW
jgi:hypothetical protein